MQSASIQLLEKAFKHPYEDRSVKDWCKDLEVNRTAISIARTRGKLSPVMAGNLARLLGEDVTYWVAVAALEAAEDSHPKLKVEECLEASKRHKTALY
jgi:plasmid maintenance system antidote protein VapI